MLIHVFSVIAICILVLFVRLVGFTTEGVCMHCISELTFFFITLCIQTAYFFRILNPNCQQPQCCGILSRSPEWFKEKQKCKSKWVRSWGWKNMLKKKIYEFLEGHSDSHLFVKLFCFWKKKIFFSPFYFELKHSDAFCR